MKSISLCIRLKIPVIYHKHPFTEIPVTEEYSDSRGTENHTKHVVTHKLLPFLSAVQNLSTRFGEQFKLAFSIPGSSVKLLQKHAPGALKEIKTLSDNGVIDFLAEPWSDSILPYFSEKELNHQTGLHKKCIIDNFGKTPTVFMAGSAVNSDIFAGFNPFPGCKTALTCSNHLNKKGKRIAANDTIQPGRAEFLINYSLSNKLQHIVSDNYSETGPVIVAPFIRYLRKHVSLVKPLILVFDPLALDISSYSKWETAITWLLKKTGSSFYSLTDLEEVAHYFYIMNDYSDAMLSQFRLADNWMRNSMQQEAFRQLINIWKLIDKGEHPYIPEAWDYLQDMNNFFYMSDSFFIEEFASRNFTPYRSPHEAFTSYMNAASNFWNIKKQNPENFFKTNFFIAPTIN